LSYFTLLYKADDQYINMPWTLHQECSPVFPTRPIVTRHQQMFVQTVTNLFLAFKIHAN